MFLKAVYNPNLKSAPFTGGLTLTLANLASHTCPTSRARFESLKIECWEARGVGQKFLRKIGQRKLENPFFVFSEFHLEDANNSFTELFGTMPPVRIFCDLFLAHFSWCQKSGFFFWRMDIQKYAPLLYPFSFLEARLETWERSCLKGEGDINGAMKKNPGCLGYVGDYTTQLYRDYRKLLQGSLLTNQYNGK